MVARRIPIALSALLWSLVHAQSQDPLPIVEITTSGQIIDHSCTLRIAKDLRLADTSGRGAIVIRGKDLIVRFEPGSALVGADFDRPMHERRGVGIGIEAAQRLRLEGAVIQGYRVAIFASNTEDLALIGARCTDLYGAALRSSAEAEDATDWITPHDNDRREWLERYGAAVWIETSNRPQIDDLWVRRSQNGLVLSRVSAPTVVDCDASFLSGFGLALWRTSHGLIARNAFDFCIRGYSHGVYNRGQDSAGILLFEQCHENAFLENSATHGGDGVFGFGGKEALALSERRGCNGNTFIGNDFSYAAAHGLELTFSFDNAILGNRFVGNAICGIWGGYSQGFEIRSNHFEANGDAGYGLERGGINIEHGFDHRITDNVFLRNACGIHLWSDEDVGLRDQPWVRANHRGSKDQLIIDNLFVSHPVAIELRATEGTVLRGNRFAANLRDVAADHPPLAAPTKAEPSRIERKIKPALGVTRPVGARAHLAGRQHIIMGRYGPWDHASPFWRERRLSPRAHALEVSNTSGPIRWPELPGGLVLRRERGPIPAIERFVIEATQPGITAYRLSVGIGETTHTFEGTLVQTTWSVAAFALEADPREDQDHFHSAAQAAPRQDLQELSLPFGMAGPGALGLPLDAARKDRFGIDARTRLHLPAGRFILRSHSDDGIRVHVDGQTLIDDWTWHAPKRHAATFELAAPREIDLVVEHFELDGFSVLELTLELAP